MLNGMAASDVPDYSWLTGPGRPEAMCITVATGLSPDEALLAFGADPDPEPVALADLVDGEDLSVAVVPLDGAVVAIEDNGWQGSRREVLRPLSRAGRAASKFWNVNTDVEISVAEGGQVLGASDPAIPGHPSGDDPSVVGPLVAGLDFGAGDRVALGMAVVERFTGVPVTPDMLEGLDRFHVIEPVLDDPPAYELRSLPVRSGVGRRHQRAVATGTPQPRPKGRPRSRGRHRPCRPPCRPSRGWAVRAAGWSADCRVREVRPSRQG